MVMSVVYVVFCGFNAFVFVVFNKQALQQTKQPPCCQTLL